MDASWPAQESAPTVTLGRFDGAYQALREEIAAAHPRRPNVEWPHVMRVVGRALTAKARFLERLAGLSPELDLARIERLPLYLDAFVYTNARCLPPSRLEERRATLAEGMALRQRLVLDLRALRLRGAPDGAAPLALSMESGFANVADDLLKLTCLAGALAQRGHVGLVGPADRARAEALALALVEACDHAATAARALKAAQRERQQAFSLLCDAYDELRGGLSFLLRRDHAALDHWAPPLARVPGRGEKSRLARMRSGRMVRTD